MKENLTESSFDQTDVALGQVRFISLFQKVPSNLVFFSNFVSKPRAGGHGVSVAVNDLNVSDLFYKSLNSPQPLFGVLAAAREHK